MAVVLLPSAGDKVDVSLPISPVVTVVASVASSVDDTCVGDALVVLVASSLSSPLTPTVGVIGVVESSSRVVVAFLKSSEEIVSRGTHSPVDVEGAERDKEASVGRISVNQMDPHLLWSWSWYP